MGTGPLLRLYHTGMIVDDLDKAMVQMGGALGLLWAPPKEAKTPLLCPEGVRDRHVRFTYSLRGPHFVELLEQIDAGPYLSLTGGRYIHHLGYYTDDLTAAAAALEAQGYRRELSGVPEDGRITRASFHYNPQAPGMWIELVSHEIAAEIGGWIAEAAAAAGVPFVSPFE
ncbi:VOC family protein [Phytohabitans sp. ZYX-F-186]|uniref:VOC family protein n=1 Tax=Phytohabitans maris TaxID=3071409 RepID=A0ABU0ZK81_9ACTN|nr:VOC family protein [Phytohabitans sp. ZYX-F-186]MDQ7907458.1 VOC family protein [Phytohabitans sp. ZYX-F-186]